MNVQTRLGTRPRKALCHRPEVSVPPASLSQVTLHPAPGFCGHEGGTAQPGPRRSGLKPRRSHRGGTDLRLDCPAGRTQWSPGPPPRRPAKGRGLLASQWWAHLSVAHTSATSTRMRHEEATKLEAAVRGCSGLREATLLGLYQSRATLHHAQW